MSHTPTELQDLRKHVRYELTMFVLAAQRLAVVPKQTNERNAWVEVYVLHMRNLIDFFYAPSVRNPRHDDVYAVDFLQGADATAWQQQHDRTTLERAGGRLVDWKKNAHKWVAHLTKTRIDRDHVVWNRKEIYETLRDLWDDFQAFCSVDFDFQFPPIPAAAATGPDVTGLSLSSGQTQRVGLASPTIPEHRTWTEPVILPETKKKPGT